MDFINRLLFNASTPVSDEAKARAMSLSPVPAPAPALPAPVRGVVFTRICARYNGTRAETEPVAKAMANRYKCQVDVLCSTSGETQGVVIGYPDNAKTKVKVKARRRAGSGD